MPFEPRPSAGAKQRCLSARSSAKKVGGLGEYEEKALRQIFGQKPKIEARHLQEVQSYTREASPLPRALSKETSEHLGNVSEVIDEYLGRVSTPLPSLPQGASHQSHDATAAHTPRCVGVRGADRLAQEVEDWKLKAATYFRENRKLQEMLEQKDEEIKKLNIELDNMRKDPHVLHPGVQRLRKMGLNTPALSDLDDRWAGYVFGRTSLAMEVGGCAFRNVFSSHATKGVLTEESFKSLIRQFEPSVKHDQLTRIWFFADEDGSGKVDLFEFMRMMGCNVNGEMSEEYYQVCAMDLYRKFHARGGVRRVFSSADKAWDHRMSSSEFGKFLKTSFKDLEFTKREVSQVFQKMNVSGNGSLSIHELESALDAAGAKCIVSETWVKETFQQLSMAAQDQAINLKQVLPGPTVSLKTFNELAVRLMPRLRPSQLDRLWKYLQGCCSDDPVEVRLSGGTKDKLPVDMVLTTMFGPTLAHGALEEDHSANTAGAQPGGPDGSKGSGGGAVGREALEQLVQQLVARIGEASAEGCFEMMEPFVTPEHFNEVLVSRLGLQYDNQRLKRIFSLIDKDRDGKLTRGEFLHMVKSILPTTQKTARDGTDVSDDNGLEKELEKTEINRLHNRLHMLERELVRQRSGGSGGRGHGSEAMVPEKQYLQLSVAHTKVATVLQNLRAVAQGEEPVSPDALGRSPRARRRSTLGAGWMKNRASMSAMAAFKLQAIEAESPLEEISDAPESVEESVDHATHANLQLQLKAVMESNLVLRKRLKVLEHSAAQAGVTLKAEDAEGAEDEPLPGPLPRTEELFGPLHHALYEFQKEMRSAEEALVEAPDVARRKKELREEFSSHLRGMVLEGRWKIAKVMSATDRSIVVACDDMLMEQKVVVKLGCCLEAGQELTHSAFIFKQLAKLEIAPCVHYFSSPYCSLPYLVMDLLQGESLGHRFEKGLPINHLEAAEFGDALLRGVHECHRHEMLNLGLCPESVWVAPPLTGSRIRILDWGAAQMTTGSRASAEFLRFQDKHKKASANSSPRFKLGSTNEEVLPHALLTSAKTRQGIVPTPVTKLAIQGHGSISYMSLEQICNLIRCYQKPTSPSVGVQQWHEESIGDDVKTDGMNAHWFQKGDGFVQTAKQVPVTPLGRLFEVEVQRTQPTSARREAIGLGFCIGFTCTPPEERPARSPGEPATPNDCWMAGGDCSFHLLGERMAVSPRRYTEASDSAPDDSFLCLPKELQKGDRVSILADWSGNLQLFVNGERVGRYSSAILPCEVMLPFYGVANLFVHEDTDEYTIRSIAVTDKSCPILVAETQNVAAELDRVREPFSAPASAALIGPSCDLYACGLLILQCFCGGREASGSLSLERFSVALAAWVEAGCPPTDTCYDLLWALKEIKSEKPERSEELSEVPSAEVRLVLSRCVKRSRYSRLGSCWEAAERLAAATSWRGMSPIFLSSHEDAVKEAEQSKSLDEHYLIAQQQLETSLPRQLLGSPENCLATWNLLPFVLGRPHVSRMVQVLSGWDKRDLIGKVSIARFEENISKELQESFLNCFSQKMQSLEVTGLAEPPTPPGISPPSPSKSLSWRAGRDRGVLRRSHASHALDTGKKPTLLLEGVALPTRELPSSTFHLEEILKRQILWLVPALVAKLDLTPAPTSLGQAKAPSVGSIPGAVEVLEIAVARSTCLTSLVLRSSDLGEHGGCVLAAAVERCSTLTELDLSDNALGPVAAAKVMHASAGHLETLNLDRNEIGSSGAILLCEPLGNCQNLKCLRLRKNGLGSDGETLSEGLMSAISLLELDVSDNEMSVSACAALLRAATASRTLQRLYLDGNLPWACSDSDEATVAMFTDQLGGHLSVASLECLSLRRCGLRSAGSDKLFESLAANASLRRLCVACNGIRQTGASKLATALSAKTLSLEELDLRDNHLGVQDAIATSFFHVFGPKAKEQELPQSSSFNRRGSKRQAETVTAAAPVQLFNLRLRVLNLANNEISSSGAVKLAQALTAFNALEELLLYHNPSIGDVGAKAIGRLCQPRNPLLEDEDLPAARLGLRRLNLAACGIGDAGCQALLIPLLDIQGVGLQALDLSCNAISDASTTVVEQVISAGTTELATLSLSMNCLSSKGVQQLVENNAQHLNANRCIVDVSAQAPDQATSMYQAQAPRPVLGQRQRPLPRAPTPR